MTDESAERARAVVAALRSSAARRPDIALLDGFTDAELDAWPVPVPEAVRVVLRDTGGLEAGGVRYVFGPRGDSHGRRPFADGHWTLGELTWGQGSLLVGVGGEQRSDWGPVAAVQPYDEPEVTVEAPGFTSWLLGLAERLADGGTVEDRPLPTVFTEAVPSVEIAESADADAELVALAGRGDSLTDLVDLRSLLAYPCGVGWEPYHSTDYNTADTGSSEVDFRLAGDGKVLLIRSMVSGDFLRDGVRRHRVPDDAGPRAVAELRALAAELPGLVSLQPGCDDAEMDTWPVPVPADVRDVLREIGGVRMPGLPDLELLHGAPEQGVDPEVHRMMGGDGTYWPVARVVYARHTALAQIRIDPDTGEWGYAVSVPTDLGSLREFPEVTLLAESLPHLLLTVARLAREAGDSPDFARSLAGATTWFFPNTGEPWTRPVPLGEWASSTDPLRAAVAGLPAGTHVADLRRAPIPTDLCFHRAEDWPYGDSLDRLHFGAGGRIAAAVPLAGGR
ncbi:hypothetical protein AR457_02935 [Streptomyces agglomeratus]|uniref:Uncharacterized protein n=1 Tax=Streptomyces agglomeratus TaxID=285458 RepID=A0A1E5P280_9ACTN|nr:hypothetical protein [Streptomyces agglomeratus]OEJ23607.1 hypothetical protein AS594_03040 [Streptomyces agglomeratus]OEJ43201.1 hypothetical protein AR457_02935 [Streptomyces agglomeratus]OEJ54877.1 hypothetical protein BGK72_32835 [Streptomyces agglomeratus]